MDVGLGLVRLGVKVFVGVGLGTGAEVSEVLTLGVLEGVGVVRAGVEVFAGLTMRVPAGVGMEVGDALAVTVGTGAGLNGGSFRAHQTTIKIANNTPAIQGHEKVGKDRRPGGAAGEGDLGVQVYGS